MSDEVPVIDPNVALQAIQNIVRQANGGDLTPLEASRLAELVDLLDRWLAGGGFLPEQWRPRSVIVLDVVGSINQPWWQVRPNELAWRYGCDEGRLMDDINPEDLSDWQFDVVTAALAICQEVMVSIRIPEE